MGNRSFRTQVNICTQLIPLLSSPGSSFISSSFEGGGGGGLNRNGGGGLFNLEKTMVSVLHKELKFKVEKLMYKNC